MGELQWLVRSSEASSMVLCLSKMGLGRDWPREVGSWLFSIKADSALDVPAVEGNVAGNDAWWTSGYRDDRPKLEPEKCSLPTEIMSRISINFLRTKRPECKRRKNTRMAAQILVSSSGYSTLAV